MQVLEETDEIEDTENSQNADADDVQRAVMDCFAEIRERTMVCCERRYVHQQDIGNNDDEAELRRSHFAVRQFELAFEVGVDADINRERQISGITERRHAHVHQRRETRSDKHKRLGDGVDVMVEVIAVERPLGVAHTG